MLMSFPVVSMTMSYFRPQEMSIDRILNWSLILIVIQNSCWIVSKLFIFPVLSFNWFWLAYFVMFVIGFIVFPFAITIQVIESQAKKAGKWFSMTIAASSIGPAIQHVIIGALWNVGGDNHPWFFRWFAVLNIAEGLLFVIYYIAKKWILIGKIDDKYERIM